MSEELKEECGVIGIIDLDGSNVALDLYHGLYALQHRGQESCGIVTNDDSKLSQEKGRGLVSENLGKKYKLDRLTGNMGVGHVRYAKTSDEIENVQPLVSRYCKGSLTLSFNGNIINAADLRHDLEMKGAIFQSTSDAEVIMNLVAIARTKCKSVEDAMKSVMAKLVGAYSIVLMSPRKIVAVRDPHGFHPLVLGKRGNEYIVTSETAALDVLGATLIRDIKSGEVLVIDNNGMRSDETFVNTQKKSSCSFELIYFARPDSIIDGVDVFSARLEIGKALARAHAVKDADVVIGAPDSGLVFAQGYSYESGTKFITGLIRNRYTGREFIKQTQSEREEEIKLKLNVVRSAVSGKNVVLVDDSIVRGTTCKFLIKMLKNAGAKSVHMRVASPAFKFPCYYGTDIPSREVLIANKMEVDQIAAEIGADSLAYLSLDALKQTLPDSANCCFACFNGEYPIDASRYEPKK